jgi:peptide-methionine (S)-S-oxide reductase
MEYEDQGGDMTQQQATFGAGCFWGVEWVFCRVPGVIDAVSGYSGGVVEDPSYREVCTDTTGHAEVVEITFDPDVVTYDQLLEIFWAMHDPTQVNRQGPDRGHQYRSIVLTHSDEQKAVAETSKRAAQERFAAPIATEITDFVKFYPAEAYHQRYYDRSGHEPYCHVLPVAVINQLGLARA